MPCYNSAAYLEEAVTCVMNQRYPSVELIVVDDGSTDESVTLLERLSTDYPSRITVLAQNHQGPFPARNLGLRKARGAFIAFLDADDYWTADCLTRLQSALESSTADLAYCGWQNVGETTHSRDPFIPPDYGAGDTTTAFLKNCPWPIHAALIRREVMDAVRGFSERRFSAMDYDLWLRIYAHTPKLTRVPEVLAFYRWHQHGQISKNRCRQVLDAVEVRQFFATHNPTLVSHLDKRELRTLTTGVLLREAYRSFWTRQLADAHALFRAAFKAGAWSMADLKYLLPSLLPYAVFKQLVTRNDREADAS
ncbi:MAG: glycosyltransferase [Gammaproteobacteria bacterium]|nr:glycosyltransferase [Gammaproteobacteria bacterium]